MDGLYVEKLMGHDLGLKQRYFKTSAQELLEGNDHKMGYVSMIDALTINEENRLRRKIQTLEIDTDKLDLLHNEIQELRDKLGL